MEITALNALHDPIQPHHNATCLGSKHQIQKRIRRGFSLNNGRQSRRMTNHADHKPPHIPEPACELSGPDAAMVLN